MRERALCRLAAVAIVAAGAVHLKQWLVDGYRSVHVIGPLFLANAVAAFILGALLFLRDATPLMLAGAGYAAATLAAFVIAVYHGLFGFDAVLHGTAQTLAGAAELAALLLLGAALAQRFALRGSHRW